MRGSPFSFSNFSRGLNVIDSPYTLQEGECRDVLNMVSSPRGAIKKRNGATTFASGNVGAFPNLAATDTFNRANESPLSNGGKWSAMLGFNTGEVLTNQWLAKTTGESAARWNVAEQTNPAVSVLISQIGAKLCRLWTCLDAGATQGYLLGVTKNFEGLYILGLSRVDAEVVTPLVSSAPLPMAAGDSIGLAVRGGIVSAWWKTGGAWVLILAPADSTYTKGYSGIQANGTAGAPIGRFGLQNFAIGEMTAPLTTEPLESLGSVVVGGVPYLIGATKTKLVSVDANGVMSQIKEGMTNGRWSFVQAAEGARVVQGPVYMSNGVDPPQYWTGATKATEAKPWTAKAEGEFVEVPKAKYLVYLANRLWAAGVSTDTSAVRFSGFQVVVGEGEKADPTNWPKENIVWFEKDDGQPITGIGIAGAYLMVFKKHKTWAVYDLNEGENRRISDQVGCISYRSILETPQGTFFLTPDQGVYVTNGTTVREVSRNVRPILQGTDSNTARAAKLNELENASAGYFNGHYYLSYTAQDGSKKTLDYDTVLQSWWLHDLAGNQWVLWEPTTGNAALYTIPNVASKGVLKAFVPNLYTDAGANYTGGRGLTSYWISPWEPFWQYFMRHRFNQPNPKKRIRELFVDGKGELITLAGRKFGTAALEELKGTVDAEDMAIPKSPLTLGTGALETQAARYWSLGVSRVWSFGFGNNSSEPLEVDSYSCHLTFRKS